MRVHQLFGLFALRGLLGFGGEPPEPVGAIPTPQQLAWHERQFYAFVHFNMNTFTGVEWGEGREAPQTFNPTALDCNQWCELFRKSGMSGVILTAKHHDGYCLWPSRFTAHDVENSPWRDGRGDVVRELAEACRRQGLWLGIYISPWDRNNPLYGKDDAAYNDYFDGQLRELLSKYGPIAEVWWDGANGDRNNPDKHQAYDWPRFIKTVRELQPQAVIFAPPYTPGDLRWVGNEQGIAGETQWATYPAGVDEDPATLNTGLEDAPTWMPAETDVSIRSGWYWTAATDNQVKSVAELAEIYYASVGRNTNLLLNVPADRRGLIPAVDAAALSGLAALIRQTFAVDLARNCTATATSTHQSAAEFAASQVTDSDPATYWAAAEQDSSPKLTIEFAQPKVINRAVIQEHIELGQRVKRWCLVARVDGEWRRVAMGTTLGHQRIVRFKSVAATAVRLRFNEFKAAPCLERVSLYAAPPEVMISPQAEVFSDRTAVTIEADRPDATIFYTLDGSIPTPDSHMYSSPIEVSSDCQLQAFAIMQGESHGGPIATRTLDCIETADLHPAVPLAEQTAPGVDVLIYDGGWQTLAQMSDRKPVRIVRGTGIDLSLQQQETQTALAFEGFLVAPKDGLYEFALGSDDGSRFYLNGGLVIDNDGLHPLTERQGHVGLRKGHHTLRVEWFNATGEGALVLKWRGPNFAWRRVTKSDLEVREELRPRLLRYQLQRN